MREEDVARLLDATPQTQEGTTGTWLVVAMAGALVALVIGNTLATRPEPAPTPTPTPTQTAEAAPQSAFVPSPYTDVPRFASPVLAQPRAAEVASVWDRWSAVIQCESGGDPTTNTGNGYYGLVQFSASTWAWMGGEEFAPLPHQATADEQLIMAERLRQHEVAQGRGGYGPWPGCARALGLPR